MQKQHRIGIMQGRLLPKYNNCYQAHPVNYWQEEFEIAAKLDLDCIEFILDYDKALENPLLTDQGNDEIQRITDRTGIEVTSICADYFMTSSLFEQDSKKQDTNIFVLEKLIKCAKNLGVQDIIIPCVDNSSLKDQTSIHVLLSSIKKIIQTLDQYDVNLCLETDLSPQSFRLLLDQIPTHHITVNYDTGNSAALGFNVEEEFQYYGNAITDIHIKDRVFGGGSVKLGTGDVDFIGFFEALKKIDYQGPFILQAYRDDEGIQIFKEQLNFFLTIYNKYY